MSSDRQQNVVSKVWRVGLALGLYLVNAGPSIHAESLYRENAFRPLIADAHAQAVGDALTVQV